jgi:hypothetical protein
VIFFLISTHTPFSLLFIYHLLSHLLSRPPPLCPASHSVAVIALGTAGRNMEVVTLYDRMTALQVIGLHKLNGL